MVHGYISHDEAALLLLSLLLFALLVFRRLPSIEAFSKFIHLLDSRGGNIAVLTFLTWLFFISALRLMYVLLSMTAQKQITPDNAVAMTGVAFVTGTAFGNIMGALLKTMTGGSSAARASDKPANGAGNGTGAPANPGQKS